LQVIKEIVYESAENFSNLEEAVRLNKETQRTPDKTQPKVPFLGANSTLASKIGRHLRGNVLNELKPGQSILHKPHHLGSRSAYKNHSRQTHYRGGPMHSESIIRENRKVEEVSMIEKNDSPFIRKRDPIYTYN
jgi:hypothetical protein